MRQRLPNCERWHPGVPSDWSDYLRKKAGVVVGVRQICLECNRARCRAHHHDLAAPAPIPEPPAITRYNVLPRLNWTPPSI
jgi:hypothetical protein